jgi:uncharacterized protein YjbI with pentapeptide repeats
MANNHNHSLYETAKYSAASLLPQVAVVLLIFLGMLAISKGNPSSELIALTFCISIFTITWLEWRRSMYFVTSKYVSNTIIESQLRLLNDSIYEWNNWRRENLSAELFFLDTDLEHADLRHADLRHANLRRANLSGANLSDADLRHADLRHADLFGANLSDADLRHADLRRAYTFGAYLGHAYLRHANLSGANLSDADLRRADLRRTDLRRADLRRTDLRRADLSDADLSGADLSGVNFEKAKVRNCQFGHSYGLAESTKTDLKQRGAIFDNASGDPSSVFAQQ